MSSSVGRGRSRGSIKGGGRGSNWLMRSCRRPKVGSVGVRERLDKKSNEIRDGEKASGSNAQQRLVASADVDRRGCRPRAAAPLSSLLAG